MNNEHVSKDWTVMVYINADNLLANFAIESLKQLRDAASKNAVVIAEFADNQQPDARIYRFDGSKKGSLSIKDNEVKNAPLETIHNVDMTRQDTLTEFIDYACDVSRTSHYCLILWGHGIELLLDEERRFGGSADNEEPAGTNGKSVRRYLSIANLKRALQCTKLANGLKDHPKTDKTLDIIGMDACSMSMVEVGTELHGSVDFMVASQDDVPDASFPYAKILSKLRERDIGSDVRKVCQAIPPLYGQMFQDYIATPNTGVKGITLSSLSLKKIGEIVDPLKRLSTALLTASSNVVLRKKILLARQHAPDFVFGLLVDLCEFCRCLKEELRESNSDSKKLHLACEEMIALLEEGENGIVIKNQANKKGCNGLSIYFPYRNYDATDEAEVQYTKGSGREPSKGSGREPSKGSGREPSKERTARIRELEADFARLTQFQQTEWSEFIRHGWSSILAHETPFELDRYYCAEQVAQNLVSPKKTKIKPKKISARRKKGAKPKKHPKPFALSAQKAA